MHADCAILSFHSDEEIVAYVLSAAFLVAKVSRVMDWMHINTVHEYLFLSCSKRSVPIARRFQLLPINQRKFPESAWKCLYCLSIWSFNYYLHISSGRHDFFHKPSHIFRDWTPQTAMSADFYAMYMLQSGFYIHSLYATMYMDHWRRDSWVMMFHHFLTLSLLVSSYIASSLNIHNSFMDIHRYHTIGTLLLFLHDFSDVALELTKINVYFKNRGGKYYKIHDSAATVGFILFAIIWFVGRLYYFPVKVLNASAHTSMIYGEQRGFGEFPFYAFFNILLLTLQALNIYWFMYILNFLYKVASGQLREVDDVREEEVQDKIRLNLLAKNHHPTQNGYVVMTTIVMVTCACLGGWAMTGSHLSPEHNQPSTLVIFLAASGRCTVQSMGTEILGPSGFVVIM
ncbi:hypothetical protein CAPTEDRAFT_219402 [Capitella teleta]|uniref:TLC domain-containing protein n=1 Tax=Capitella teleta TaxID=283909 RepID=R7UWV7_CAPTE|nr:hypothetical protein CAPTEDRAFT_219402 [Capitella teleta]|eukprot:ELU10742.1 hypothetical protein CAPTEDRAFT_219402 [Capitella teleta]